MQFAVNYCFHSFQAACSLDCLFSLEDQPCGSANCFSEWGGKQEPVHVLTYSRRRAKERKPGEDPIDIFILET